jgi:uncharacterized damage-inducible protein DinB
VTTLPEHSRAMLSYNRWANERIFRAAAGLPPEGFAAIRDTLNHALATQQYWFANWTGRDFEEKRYESLDELRSEYEAIHADILLFAQRLDDDEWQRAEAWWKKWGYDNTLPVGDTVFQVVYHGIQHRAEIASILTAHDCSPGDLDYLQFLQETQT